jgi:hypothetical protein
MGQILHGCAATTAALRRAIQNSQESLSALANRFHINVKTVAKWRKRTSVKDLPMSPHEPHSTGLTAEQEAIIVAFRRQTLLPLDDCLYALQPSVSNLTLFKFTSVFEASAAIAVCRRSKVSSRSRKSSSSIRLAIFTLTLPK